MNKRVANNRGGIEVWPEVLDRFAIGLAVGLPLAIVSTRVLRSPLFEVSPKDPTTLGIVTTFLTVAALMATYFPARCAARVDPAEALRTQ